LLLEISNTKGYSAIECQKVLSKFLTQLEINMSVAETISMRIKYMQKGKPFGIGLFVEVGARAPVDKALSRMVQSGVLERVARGVYMRPKVSKYAGNVRPNPTAVMRVIAKSNGETIQVHGSEAVRMFQLSTQMQTQPTFYTSGSTRELKIGNGIVRLQHASSVQLQLAGKKSGAALVALHYIGKNGLTRQIAQRILTALSSEEVNQLLSCKMPAWMRSAVDESASLSGGA
jgi:hypothetical protein